MLTFTDDELKQQIQDEVGIKPEFALEAFSERAFSGYFYDVCNGELRQIVQRRKCVFRLALQKLHFG